MKTTKTRNLCIIASLVLCTARAAVAGTDVWTGGGGNNNWSNPNNWASHTAPAYSDSLIFQGTLGTSPNNDLVASTNSFITFSNNASAFALAGNAITLSHADTPTMIGVTNSSANAQTISQDINLSWGNFTFESPSGSLALNGLVTAGQGGVAYLGTNLTSSSLTVDPTGLITGLSGAALKASNSAYGSFSGLATVSGGSIIPYTGGTQVPLGDLGSTTQSGAQNLNLSATPASGTRVNYTLPGGTGNTYANTIVANGGYAGTIDIGVSTNAGQLILGSAAGNWVGGIYVPNPTAATSSKLVEVTNQFLTAGPDNTLGGAIPGTIVLAVNGTSGGNLLNIYSMITNNPSGGAVSVVKTGPGGVFYGPLASRGLYSGGTYINQGVMQFNGNSMSAGPYFIGGNASVYIRSSSSNEISFGPGVGNTTWNYGGVVKSDGATHSGKITLTGAPATQAPGNRFCLNGNVTLTGRITGSGTLEAFANNGTTWALNLGNTSATATNDWTGGLFIDGTINSTVTLNSSNQLNGNSVSFFTATAGKFYALNLNGKNDLVGSLNTTNAQSTVNASITNTATTPCTLTLGANDASGTFNGVIVDAGSSRAINLVKIGAGTQTFGGTLNYSGSTMINQGTLAFSQMTAFPSISLITVNTNGRLDLSAICPLTMSSLSMSNNASLVIGRASGLVSITNLTLSGLTNQIQLTSVPMVSSYPTQIPLLTFTNLAGVLNFGLKGLPSVPGAGTPYAGYIVNNAKSVDLILTQGPVGITWTGSVNSGWDLSSLNWLVGGSPSAYSDGQIVAFPDSGAKTVSLIQNVVVPFSMTVSNAAVPYIFVDSGNQKSIASTGFLLKQGSGTMILDNSGTNTFANGITIASGTLQVGNNDSYGNVASPIVNNGTLVIARNDAAGVFSSSIGGSGNVVVQGSGTIMLSGANSYTNVTTVQNNTILKAGNTLALGSSVGPTVITSGSTLDINGVSLGNEVVQVAGNGTAGQGAIDNTGGIQNNALTSLTLTGDATLGASVSRWDLRSPTAGANSVLSTGGHAYNLNIAGAATAPIFIVDAVVDPALANVEIQSGILGCQGSTTGLGNPTSSLMIDSAADLFLYSVSTPLNKPIRVAGLGIIQNNTGNNTLSGPITLTDGSVLFEINGTSTLTISGSISGPGRPKKIISSSIFPNSAGNNDTGTLVLSGTNSFSGGLYMKDGTTILNGDNTAVSGDFTVAVGTLIINGTVGSSAINVQSTSVLAGLGKCNGLVDLSGNFNPGAIGGAGTFTASGGMTIEDGATLTFDLDYTNIIGSGVNDLLAVDNGDLTLNGSATININALRTLQKGTYRLINYTGNLVGSFSSVQSAQGASSTRYTYTLDYSTPHQINVVITGEGPRNLLWSSTSNTNWDAVSSNWINLATAGSSTFLALDTVLLDDTANVVTNISIAANTTVWPSFFTNSSSANNFTITGPGGISGNVNLVKTGDSTLTISSPNSFVGTVSVLGGKLRVGSTTALGSTNVSLVASNGGSFDLNDMSLRNYEFNISGAGFSDAGAIVNNTATAGQTLAVGRVVLNADASFGGTARWDVRSPTANVTNAYLITKGKAYSLTKTGSNDTWIVDAFIDPALANINLQSGSLGVEGVTTSLGNPTNTLTVYSNATFNFYQASNAISKVVVLNDGGRIQNVNGSNAFAGPITLMGAGWFIGTGTELDLSNVISGSGGLIKSNSVLLVISGANTYTGRTLISGGVLALKGSSASIGNSSNVTISSGATLDVSGAPGASFPLRDGQTLMGSGVISGNLSAAVGSTLWPGGETTTQVGTLAVTNSVVLSGTTVLSINHGIASSQLRATNITYGGTLVVTNVNAASPFVVGDSYKLFSAGAYNGSAFAQIIPSAPGLGLAWDTTQLAVDGSLKVVAGLIPLPHVAKFTINGNSLSVSGTNGLPGGQYRILTSTNVALPLGQWVPIATNSYDMSGNFIFNGLLENSGNQMFYIIVTP